MYQPEPELNPSIAIFRDVEHAMSQAVSLQQALQMSISMRFPVLLRELGVFGLAFG